MYERGIKGSFATTRPSNLKKRIKEEHWITSGEHKPLGYRKNRQALLAGHQSRQEHGRLKSHAAFSSPSFCILSEAKTSLLKSPLTLNHPKGNWASLNSCFVMVEAHHSDTQMINWTSWWFIRSWLVFCSLLVHFIPVLTGFFNKMDDNHAAVLQVPQEDRLCFKQKSIIKQRVSEDICFFPGTAIILSTRCT